MLSHNAEVHAANDEAVDNTSSSVVFPCDKCEIVFSDEASLQDHRRTHHSDEATENRENPPPATVPSEGLILYCSLCKEPKEYRARVALLRHLSYRHFLKQLMKKFLKKGFVPKQNCEFLIQCL